MEQKLNSTKSKNFFTKIIAGNKPKGTARRTGINNVLKNIRISTLVLMMSVLSVIFILIIGLIGSINMNKMNKNMASIYDNNLVPITTGTEIRSSFLNMEMYTIQAIFNYDYTVESQINLYKQKVQNFLDQYEKNNLDNTEKVYIDNFKGVFDKYNTLWKDERAKLLKGQSVPTSDYINFTLLGKKAEDNLMAISNYNKQTAQSVISKGSKESSMAVANMSIITIVSLFISIILSTLVILMIRKYSKDIISVIQTLAKGDFRVKIDTSGKNEFGIMKNYLSTTIEKIEDILKNIRAKSINIDTHSTHLNVISEEMSSYSAKTAHAISEVADGTTSQAEKLTEILDIINDFSQKLDEIVSAIDKVNDSSGGINKITNESSSNMNFLIDSVTKVSESFKYFESKLSKLDENIDKINDITNVINAISEQTNLLALNAAIEAARAGEAGKGFSVVADQIRKLSEQSKSSLSEINKLIQNIVEHTKDILTTTSKMDQELNGQVKVINNSISYITNIVDSVNAITPQIGNINSSALNIRQDKNNILGKMEEVSAIAEEVSASAQDISSSASKINTSSSDVADSSQSLSDMTSEMMESVNKFTLKEAPEEII